MKSSKLQVRVVSPRFGELETIKNRYTRNFMAQESNILHKARTAVRILRERNGFHLALSILKEKYGLPIPQSTSSKWKAGTSSELSYWDNWCRIKGYECGDTYEDRLDPNLPLQPRPAALIPSTPTEVHILDVGAGPLTYLGKKRPENQICITAVDPLADKYNRILNKYKIQPIVKTQQLAAEDLTREFHPNTYDLVFARNCIDHSHNPEKAILQMIKVVKKGEHVLLEHRINEADTRKYEGLHQWNFTLDTNGNFLISSKSKTLNVTTKYAAICSITSEIIDEGRHGVWLVVRIKKLQ